MIPTGIAVSGFYVEWSKVIGNFFQISNQFTLGWTEQGILDRVIPFIKRFVSLERDARDRVMNDDRIIIEDKIYRALGILANVRILSSRSSFRSSIRCRFRYGQQYKSKEFQ